MSGQLFDELSKALAAGASRRHLMRLLLASVTGGALVSRFGTASAASCAALAQICTQRGDRPCCPDGTCLPVGFNGAMLCSQACQTDSDCAALAPLGLPYCQNGHCSA
jgi:hypothetical protein